MPESILKASKRQWMSISRIVKKTPFMGLFPDQPDKVEAIADHMRQHGYDTTQPIVLWEQPNGGGKKTQLKSGFILIDGHTRFEAAKKASLNTGVYVAKVKFPNEKAALDHAIHNQRDRRNMDDSSLYRCIEAVDKKYTRGGDRKSEKSKTSDEAFDKPKSSAEETAKAVMTSKTKVEKVRTIEKHADDETKEAVKSGKKSINKAYKETQAKRKPSKKNQDNLKPGPNESATNEKPAKDTPPTLTNTEQPPITWQSLPTILANIGLFLTDHKTPPDELENRKEAVSAIKTHIQFLNKHLDEIA